MLQKLKDWWRGYSDADIMNAVKAVEKGVMRPGGVVKLSPQEFKAYTSMRR